MNERTDKWWWYEKTGRVRMRVEEDVDVRMFVDSFDPKANPHIQPHVLERLRQETIDRINREGVWGIITEYHNGEEWMYADSCWGFIGDDWKDSSHTLDAMEEAMEAWNNVRLCPECGRPRRQR